MTRPSGSWSSPELHPFYLGSLPSISTSSPFSQSWFIGLTSTQHYCAGCKSYPLSYAGTTHRNSYSKTSWWTLHSGKHTMNLASSAVTALSLLSPQVSIQITSQCALIRFFFQENHIIIQPEWTALFTSMVFIFNFKSLPSEQAGPDIVTSAILKWDCSSQQPVLLQTEPHNGKGPDWPCR